SVRHQFTFTPAEYDKPHHAEMLAMLARRDAGDRWVSAAILSSISTGSADIYSALFADKQFRSSKPGRSFIQSLVVLAGAGNAPQEINSLLLELGKTEDDELIFSLTRALMEGIAQHGSPAPRIAE